MSRSAFKEIVVNAYCDGWLSLELSQTLIRVLHLEDA